ncbi:Eco57I restriction-modification methylase domain-containing protein [Streptomyces sp. DH41]|uniref:Eco57I restriction-modification methylase domain-containing protein n=1 Tax=Streptomyces sp. DH41 TaxID=3040125 RepID=UPI0024412897|nr:DNA methyltransferase [Streptomyces sp. DH41]MDG9723534.1 N-6 DNA methylase [Streptomyces sp. DH41]
MSATTRNQVFTAVHTVGGLLPADMLVRISEGKDVPGSKPADYGMPSSRSVRDEAERSWEYLKPLWRDLRKHLPENPETGVPATDPTGRADTDWLAPLWQELGFGRLTPVGPAGITADSDTEKKFPVSHRSGHALIHQTAWNAELDKRPGGAGTVPPQSMLQECLNRTEAHLWGVLTNGRQVRLLRDSSALATASYVEFDLEAIFDGELFSEFVLLYRLLHVSRFEVAEASPPSSCWLEKWRTEAIASGTRALAQLRKGVQEAITALGTGFLRHAENGSLREDVRPKPLQKALLRLVYRLLFVFVAEDRDALLSPGADGIARERYENYFSSARLRAHARKRRGTAHGDLYEALRIVLTALGEEEGRPELALPGLGGLFNETDTDAPLHDLKLSNEALLTAVRHLSQVRDGSSGRWRAVDYRHLDAEELGSVYESLLELEPKYSAADRTFTLIEVSGNTRKTTGSYYTPSSLIECLLNSSLDPVIGQAVKRGEEAAARSGAADPADAIVNELLSLTVCDPACGSGHFLVAAARRIAKQVAAVRERNPEPTLDAVRHALHEVVARCIYGVDLNLMAVDLAKVSLWLEALEPGKPLNFLDAHIKHGNALVGATPALLRDGVPDRAFKPIEGDDKKFARALERQNRQERGGQRGLFDLATETKVANTRFAFQLRRITTAESGTLAEVRRQEAAYHDWSRSAEYVHALHVADAWCAAFVWPKRPSAPLAVTEELFQNLQDPATGAAPQSTHDQIGYLKGQYTFFHWHLEFPDVFSVPESGTGAETSTGWVGGFDCVLGNPPWDQVQVDAREFFAATRADITEAPTMAARNRIIKNLASEDPELHADFANEQRINDGFKHFVHSSGHFPLTAYGRLNTYSLFSELARRLASPEGTVGQIIPTGIATDSFNQHYFNELINRKSLVSLYDFRNTGFFGDVAGAQGNRFCLLVSRSAPHGQPLDLAFRLESVSDLGDASRRVQITPEEIQLVNPNTGTCPIFKSSRDARITIEVYKRLPVLIRERTNHGNAWHLDFQLMFMTNTDSHLFRKGGELREEGWQSEKNTLIADTKRMLPLYEAKMLHQYNHRFGDYALTEIQAGKGVRSLPTPLIGQLDTPTYFTEPRYWIPEASVDAKLTEKGWRNEWVMGFRKITSSLDERSVIAFLAPRGGVADSANVILPRITKHVSVLYAQLSSFIFDYVARQKLGGVNLNFFIFAQLPTLLPSQAERHAPFVNPRVLELAYSAYDMQGFAREKGDAGTPFRWDETRRQGIRAELDALFFHLYGISREDVDYILDTFPIVRRKEEAKYGTYRTKELILTEYDRMAAAGLSLETPLVDGENYTSTLAPPPGHGPRHPA